jgi:hypothetical protein
LRHLSEEDIRKSKSSQELVHVGKSVVGVVGLDQNVFVNEILERVRSERSEQLLK